MIRCPQCGGMAPWGAMQCPNCGAAFVAPPAANPYGWPNARFRTSNVKAPAAMVAAMILLFLAFGAWGYWRVNRDAQLSPPGLVPPLPGSLALSLSVNPPPPSSLKGQGSTPSNTPLQEEAPEHQGIFTVKRQAALPPIVAIGNGSEINLRFSLQDSAGEVETQWIAPFSTQEVTVKEGQYSAMVDAPDTPGVIPISGTVNVKSFHHYEADFFIDNGMRPNDSFHIGD